ncbi:hypothetical protein BBJ28_00012148 [Nothophytophthora sp. Chile5]|nr:hypothetical protein BBJ28_00012148 [Nothophytophthora sp. Chile5]
MPQGGKRKIGTAARQAKKRAVKKQKPTHTCVRVPRGPTSLLDVVMLLHLQLVPFLKPEDLARLLGCVSRWLPPDVRDSIATAGLKTIYTRECGHFGEKCIADWHQLMPEAVDGGEGPCATCDAEPPQDFQLPRLSNARMHLLQAACVMSDGILPACGGPVMFSLAEALEKQQGKEEGEQKKLSNSTGQKLPTKIDTNNVEQLTRLMDSVEIGFGTRFFSSRKQNFPPTGAVEAHWRGITVDLEANTAECQFCESIASSVSSHRCERCTEVYAGLLQQHCTAIYQPRKAFMLHYLKHVRYVKPPRGWNCAADEFRQDRFLDFMGGFTPAGVLCGVYLTDLRIPEHTLTRQKLAPGAFE